MAPLLFSVFEYLDWYSTYFDVTCFRTIWIDGNRLQVCHHIDKRCRTAVANRMKRMNVLDGCSAFLCRRVGNETDLPFLLYREGVSLEGPLVEVVV